MSNNKFKEVFRVLCSSHLWHNVSLRRLDGFHQTVGITSCEHVQIVNKISIVTVGNNQSITPAAQCLLLGLVKAFQNIGVQNDHGPKFLLWYSLEMEFKLHTIFGLID